MFSQQSTSESIEAGVPQNYYYVHAGNSSNSSVVGHHADALTTTTTDYYSSSNTTADATYAIQPQPPQQHNPLAVDHNMLPMTYESAPHMNDACLAEKEVDQYPSVEEFDKIVQDYLNNLSTKKRDKALVDRHRYTLIRRVLKDPRNTAISTAQFRFWVKKMFQFVPQYDGSHVVCHDNKPVAMREDIYGILVQAHKQANHGGRDKTSALVRRRYSWIPKELIARFVRHCPFCITRRNGSQNLSVSLLPRSSASCTAELAVAAPAPADAPASSTAAFVAQDVEYHTGPPTSIEGLSYLAGELKPSINQRNFDIKWSEHQHQALQPQAYFLRPLESSRGNIVSSPASSSAEHLSAHDYSNVFFSTVAAPNASSCALTPCLSQEAGGIYQHPALLSPCGDMPTLPYGHVERPPLYNTCYIASPETSMDPLTIIPRQHPLHQTQQPYHVGSGSSTSTSDSNPSDLYVTSYYASEHQTIPYDQKIACALSVESGQSQHLQTMTSTCGNSTSLR
ncbi:hypothetical protein BX666DRAFT_2005045 [Dichotomocladium elegans]|nr:hypothetical protein BX666DRAFT_2005045 [Dichotomocladium elegans]